MQSLSSSHLVWSSQLTDTSYQISDFLTREEHRLNVQSRTSSRGNERSTYVKWSSSPPTVKVSFQIQSSHSSPTVNIAFSYSRYCSCIQLSLSAPTVNFTINFSKPQSSYTDSQPRLYLHLISSSPKSNVNFHLYINAVHVCSQQSPTPPTAVNAVFWYIVTVSSTTPASLPASHGPILTLHLQKNQ